MPKEKIESFRWEAKYETGNALIDGQHKRLFKQMDSLALALYKGKSKSELNGILGFLENYVREHFTTEEDLMMKNENPEFQKHRSQHLAFRDIIKQFRWELESRGADAYLALKVEKELRNWWMNHILKTDISHAQFLK